ncbi:MAG TPA: hypothetical protein VI754_17415 [Bacteriovoracaceae bacterium]|nr:hypothetical protein [Bacteriovoracaceae bacterium]
MKKKIRKKLNYWSFKQLSIKHPGAIPLVRGEKILTQFFGGNLI